MSTTIQVKRGTTSKIANYTGKQGELVFDTEAKALYVMDGTNKGGHLLGIPEVIDGGIIPEPKSVASDETPNEETTIA